MAKKELNLIIAIIILLTCVACVPVISSLKRMPSRDIKLLEFPLRLGDWTGQDIRFDDKEFEKQIYQILGTDKVLLRLYADSRNERVSMQVVYSDEKRQSFHPPEYCYLGSGNNELLEKGKVRLTLEDGKEMIANKAVYQSRRGKILLLDWYTAGDLATENYYKQQAYFVINQLKREKGGGSAIRVWTPIIDGDYNMALKRCQRFIREVLKILPKYI